MLCFRCRKLLIPYSEGELESRAWKKVERHLSRCERCRCDLKAIRSVAGTLLAASTPAVEPAPDLWARVRARIAGETPKPAPRVWPRVPQAVSAAATVVLIAAVGVTLMRSGILTQRHDYAPPKSQEAQVGKQAKLPQAELGGRGREQGPVETGAGAAESTPEKPSKDQEVRSPVVGAPVPTGAAAPREKVAEIRPSTHRPAGSEGRPATPDSRYERVAVAADATLVADAAAGGMRALGAAHFHGDADVVDRADSMHGESVVDALNETEGIRMAALFTYP